METAVTSELVQGGRGARARIVTAATALFYERGISTTGIKELTDAAHVSTRTFYQHFPSKDDLVVEYLSRFDSEHLLANEAALEDLNRAPRDRILGLFDSPPADSPLRGCPFHNASVEAPALDDSVRRLVAAHKRQFLARVVQTAREAGLRSPRSTGFQLAILYEGTGAWCTSTGDPAAVAHARRAAAQLMDLASS